MGGLAVTMVLGLVFLSILTKTKIAESVNDLQGAPAGYYQKTMIAQIAQHRLPRLPGRLLHRLVHHGTDPGAGLQYRLQRFSVLGSILAQDSYLPRQLHTRG